MQLCQVLRLVLKLVYKIGYSDLRHTIMPGNIFMFHVAKQDLLADFQFLVKIKYLSLSALLSCAIRDISTRWHLVWPLWL